MLPTPVTSRPPVESRYRNPLPHSFPFSLLNEWKVSRGSESCTSALPPATTAVKEVEEEEEGEEEKKISVNHQDAGGYINIHIYIRSLMQLLQRLLILVHKQKSRLHRKTKNEPSWRFLTNQLQACFSKNSFEAMWQKLGYVTFMSYYCIYSIWARTFLAPFMDRGAFTDLFFIQRGQVWSP